MSQENRELDALAWKFLDQEISQQEFERFESLLEENAANRERYQFLVEMHHAITGQAQLEKPSHSASSTEADYYAETVKTRRSNWKWPSLAAIAACIAVSLTFLFSSGADGLRVEYVALRQADIRGKEIRQGDTATTRMVHLASGAIALQFPGKTEVVIEGPAWYQVQNDRSIVLSSGTLTVHHQGKPGDFTVVTPLGELVDMGTKFGVSVGDGISDSMVLTEVYEGEVVYSDDQNARQTLKAGEGIAILGKHGSRKILREINGQKVKVAGQFQLEETNQKLKTRSNLALGKPVVANSAYTSLKNGEVFGPQALTDGRLYDTGAPWDWSFWIAENGVPGTATVDLLGEHSISKVELQNTRNRHYDDRGMKDFVIELSTDGKEFEEVARGTLPRVKVWDSSAYPITKITFPTRKARYVRVRGLSYYSRPGKDHRGCGGLNEIRVFE